VSSSASARADTRPRSRSTTAIAIRFARRTYPRLSRSFVASLSLLLADTDERDLTQLSEYRAVDGYTAVDKARALTPLELITEFSASNLRGRGGAGFPIGRKASLIDRASPKPKYLVVNA